MIFTAYNLAGYDGQGSSMKRSITFILMLVGVISMPLYAGYYNAEDSGFFGSLSGGAVTSQSSGTWTTAPDNETRDFTAPATTGGAGSARLGYRLAFGEQDSWNEFYLGGAARYNILGNTVTNIVGIRNLDVAYSQTSVNQFGAEGLIGKYWKSPFYTELFVNPGFTDQGSFFGAIGLRAGYDINEHWSVFAEGMTGGQIDTASGLVDLVFWQVGISGTSYSAGQAGIQYRF